MADIIDKVKEKAKDVKDKVVDTTKDVVDAAKYSVSTTPPPSTSISHSYSTERKYEESNPSIEIKKIDTPLT